MGRTLPSTTVLVFELIAGLEPFYGALRRSDQLILDKFFEDALQHRAAISNAASLLPMEVMPFVILLEEHKRINSIHNNLYSLIEELDHKFTSSVANSPLIHIISVVLFMEEHKKNNNIPLEFDGLDELYRLIEQLEHRFIQLLRDAAK